MRIAEFAVRRKVTVLMAVLATLLLGAISYGRLPVQLLPGLSSPAAAVITAFPGANPTQVELLLSRPMEQAVAALGGVTGVRSSSQDGLSVVTVEFRWGTNMEIRALELAEKANQAASSLPSGAGAPLVVRFDPALLPLMLVSLSGGDDQTELREFGDGYLRDRLERLEGVASVAVAGGSRLEVAIEVDEAMLIARGVSWSQLRAALMAMSAVVPDSQVTERGRDFTVRTPAGLESLSDLRNLVVGVLYSGTGAAARPVPVRLADVSRISIQASPGGSVARSNGQPAVALAIYQSSSVDARGLAGRITAELAALQPLLPPGARLEATLDQAEFAVRATGQLAASAAWGAGLAALVLCLALLDLRAAAVVIAAVPAAMAASFLTLDLAGLSLNLMTAGGLAAGLGLLAGNSLLVLLSIRRRVREGEPVAAAAAAGTAEVLPAAGAAVAAAVALSIPFVFMGGPVSALFRGFAATLGSAAAVAFLLAALLVPMGASLAFRPLAAAGEAAAPPSGSYAGVLGWTLSNRTQVLLMCLLCLMLGWQSVSRVGGELLPTLDRGEFVITVQMAPGTALERTDQVIRGIEEIVRQLPEVSQVTGISGGQRLPAAATGAGLAGTDLGTVTVKLVGAGERMRGTREVIEELERGLWVPGARVAIEQLTAFSNPGVQDAVELAVRGPDPEVLAALSDELRNELAELPQLGSVQTATRIGRPEIRINYRPDQLAIFGLSQFAAAEQVGAALAGDAVGTLQPGGTGAAVDVVLRYTAPNQDALRRVRALTLLAPDGRKVRLEDVATITETTGPAAIERLGGERCVVITAQVAGPDLAGAMRRVRTAVAGIDLPSGYDVVYGGDGRAMMDAFSGLAQSVVLAVVLVYMVLAAHFESLVYPLLALGVLPLAAFGAAGALWLAGYSFSLAVLVGLVLLAALAVSNAVVLLDRIKQLRRRGLRPEVAVAVAGRDRLPSIILTSLVVVATLVPIALHSGEAAGLAVPMALTVIGGLSAATLVTVLLVPALYVMSENLLAKLTPRSGPNPLDISDLTP